MNTKPSIQYIIEKINDIKIENNTRNITKISSNYGDNTLCISFSDTNILGDEAKFYRKYNFKLFEVFKEIFNVENIKSEEYPTNLKFRNSSCNHIYYDVFNIWIHIDLEKWESEYKQIIRDIKLKELGL